MSTCRHGVSFNEAGDVPDCQECWDDELDSSSNPFEEEPPFPEPQEAHQKPATLVDYLEKHLLDSAGLDSITDPEPLILGDILFADTLNWLVGKPGHGKSFVAIDMAGAVATGADWQGNSVVPGRVLYLAAEGVRGLKRRVRAWERVNDMKMTGVDFLPFPVQSTNQAHWGALVALAERRGYVLIVLDTQARITVGIEENSNREMGVFVHQAEQLRAASGACVLIVHHIGRNGETGRGATTLDGALSTIIKASKDATIVTLECQKNKDAEEWPKIELKLVPTGDSATLQMAARISGNLQVGPSSAALMTANKWWEMHAGDWMSATRLIDTLGITSTTFYRHKEELRKAGVVESREYGKGYQFSLPHDPSQAHA